MTFQDNTFNNKIIIAALVAVILGILIAFYYSYAQAQTEISYLEQEKSLLVKDLTLMQSEVDRLSALNEVNEIELDDSRNRVQQLLDSVGRLNFNIGKLREDRKVLRNLEAQFDSLKLRNNYLRYTNLTLTDQYEEARKLIEELQGRSNTMAETEAQLRETTRELSLELRRKNYLVLGNPEGSGFRLRNDRPIKTNKASTIEKLRGCVTLVANPTVTTAQEKVIYLQFLGPDMGVIEDNAQIISVNGNIYSKRVELLYLGEELNVCDFITVPGGSLGQGTYTLNVFEDERLLTTTEFELK